MQLEFESLAKQLLGEQIPDSELSPQLDPETGEAEDWKPWMTRNIVKKGSDFLRGVYELGYTGEAGDSDINEIVAQLAQEAEVDERLQRALDAVVTHMVKHGQQIRLSSLQKTKEFGSTKRTGTEKETIQLNRLRNIVAKGSDFLRGIYELGYTGEAGDSDINEIVAQLAQEAKADERLQRALDAVVTHMVNAGHSDS